MEFMDDKHFVLLFKVLICLILKSSFFCYIFSVIPYRAVIIPIKKLSNAMTTSNPWVCVSGELGDSGTMQIPKNVLEMTFDVSAPASVLLFSWQQLLLVCYTSV